jgi:hypothetical protein
MPIELVWEQAGYHKRYHGVITAREIAESVRAQCADERFQSVRYAINEYAADLTITTEDPQIGELEQLEVATGYRTRGILLAYVTQDPVLIDFLCSVYLESVMLIYPTMSEARHCIDRLLRENHRPDPEGCIDPARYLGTRDRLEHSPPH